MLLLLVVQLFVDVKLTRTVFFCAAVEAAVTITAFKNVKF